MTGEEIKAAREQLGLSAAGLAAALKLPSRWSDRTVRSWERGEYPAPGPVVVAIRYMLKYGVLD